MIIETLIELIQAYDAKSIKDLPGAWECQVDDQWYVAINGHAEEISVKPEGMMRVNIPAYHFVIWFNGWLAGFVNPYNQGFIAENSLANEEEFEKAIKDHIKERATGGDYDLTTTHI